MKNLDLPAILKTLGLPVGLVALFSATLGLLGVDMAVVLSIAGSMVGTFVLVSLIVDVLKWAGAVSSGDAGKWSAAGNLIIVVGVAVAYYFYPDADFVNIDVQIGNFANVAVLAFAWIVQVSGSKWFHELLQRLGFDTFRKVDADEFPF